MQEIVNEKSEIIEENIDQSDESNFFPDGFYEVDEQYKADFENESQLLVDEFDDNDDN